jgi:hypothetical protein
MLSRQKLKDYGKALAVVASLSKHSAAWDKRHAVIDQQTVRGKVCGKVQPGTEQPYASAVFWKKAGGLWKQTARLQLNSGRALG